VIAVGATAPDLPSWTEAAAAVADAVETLARVPVADLADAQLAPAMAEVATQASRLHSIAVDVVSEADMRRVWKTQGASSLRGWVRRCVQLADDSTRVVTAARTRRFMPKMTMLFSAGHVSLAQMGTAARQIRRLPDVPAWPSPDAPSPDAPSPDAPSPDAPSPDAPSPDGPSPDGPRPDGSSDADTSARPNADTVQSPAGSGAADLEQAGSWDEGAARWDEGAARWGEGAARWGEGAARWGEDAARWGEDAARWGDARWGDLRSAADEILAERAATFDARMLAAVGEQIHAAADPRDHLGDALSRHDRRHLSISKSFEGMGEVTGRLDPEATARAITVLDALAQKAGPDDDRTAAARRADAFDTMCKAWLESGGLPAAQGGAPNGGAPNGGTSRREQVIVTIPFGTLLGLPGATGAVLGDGTPITAETARRLACAASVRRVVVAPPAGWGTCACGHTCAFAIAPDWASRPDGAADPERSPRNDHASAGGRTPGTHARPSGDAAMHKTAAPNGDHTPGDSAVCDDAPPHRHAASDGHGAHHGSLTQLAHLTSHSGAASGGDTAAGIMRWASSLNGSGARPDGSGRDPSARLAAILRDALAWLPPPLGARSAVLDAGRATPVFTSPMKDALHAKYGGRCTFPRCGGRATINHHIIHWAHGGRTSVANSAPVCEYHHYLVHEGGWRLCKDRLGVIVAVPPPPDWPGLRRHWRNGRPIAGKPPTSP